VSKRTSVDASATAGWSTHSSTRPSTPISCGRTGPPRCGTPRLQRRHARPVRKTTREPRTRDRPGQRSRGGRGRFEVTAPMLRVTSCASTASATMRWGSCGKRSRSTDPGIRRTQGGRGRSGHGGVEYDVLGFGFDEISPEDRQPHSPSTRGSTAGRDRPRTRTIAHGDQALANGFRHPRA
jgi:hypothetical protein